MSTKIWEIGFGSSPAHGSGILPPSYPKIRVEAETIQVAIARAEAIANERKGKEYDPFQYYKGEPVNMAYLLTEAQ